MTFWLEVSNITCVMMNDQENTIEKIKQTALDEFFMHGYNKASLRTICSRAGVTTGAMYFYFKNKEALFREIFEPLVVQYEELLVRYMKLELAEPELGTQLDVQMMQFILEHRKEAVIILEKAQGSCYEMYRSKVEQLMEQSIYTFYKSRMDYEPDEKFVKILAKIRLDGCLEIIKGNYSMEDSLYLVEKIGIYSMGGTDKLIQNLREPHSI